jgi:hypothetical protein
MKPGRIAIAFGLLLVLYGAYAYYEMVTVKQREEAQKAASLLLSIDPEKIIKVEVKGKISSFTLKKSDGKWSITHPFAAKVNILEVNDILDTAKNITSEKQISGDDIKLSEYGLDKPATALFYVEGESEPQKFLVGVKSPARSAYYVMTNSDPTVYIVRNWRVDSIFPTLFEVREKRMFSIRPNQVTSFLFRVGEMSLSAKKEKNNRWRITSPIETDADDSSVNDLLIKLILALASGFIDEKVDDLAIYGLDNPFIEFSADFGKNGNQRLLIGGVTPDGNRYAMMAEKKEVVRITGDTFDNLPDSVEALRDFSIAKFEPEDVNELLVEFAGESVKIVSEAVGQGDNKKWRITEPVKTDADQVEVDTLLSDLRNSRADAIVEKGDKFDPARFGLNDPTLTISLNMGETSTSLKFGIVKQESNRFYLQVDGRPMVMEISAEVYTDVAKTLFELRDKRLFPSASEDVGKIVIKRLGELFEIVKSGNDYRLVSPENIRLTPNQWNRLVWEITNLKYDGFYKSSEQTDNKVAQGKPSLEIMLYDGSGELVESVTVGSRDKDKGGFYVRTAVKKGLYNIDEKFVTKDIIGLLENLIGKEEIEEIVNPHKM